MLTRLRHLGSQNILKIKKKKKLKINANTTDKYQFPKYSGNSSKKNVRMLYIGTTPKNTKQQPTLTLVKHIVESIVFALLR